jgi:hypothetical protein
MDGVQRLIVCWNDNISGVIVLNYYLCASDAHESPQGWEFMDVMLILWNFCHERAGLFSWKCKLWMAFLIIINCTMICQLVFGISRGIYNEINE